MLIMAGPMLGNSLGPQEYFNKALEMVLALKPTAEAKKYSNLEL
jgi:hypothetical protein